MNRLVEKSASLFFVCEERIFVSKGCVINIFIFQVADNVIIVSYLNVKNG